MTLALVLMSAPAFAAQEEPKGRLPLIEEAIQFLTEQINLLWQQVSGLKTQIDEIEYIPGPPGEPGEQGPQGESGITEIVTDSHHFYPQLTSSYLPSDIPHIGLQISVAQPTDVVIVYTAQVVPPNNISLQSRGTKDVSLKYRKEGKTDWTRFRHYIEEGNRGTRQFNFHAVVELTEAGDYEFQLEWYHNIRDPTQDWSWNIQYATMTIIVSRGQ